MNLPASRVAAAFGNRQTIAERTLALARRLAPPILLIAAGAWIIKMVLLSGPQIFMWPDASNPPDFISFWTTAHDALNGEGAAIYNNEHLCRAEQMAITGTPPREQPLLCTLFLYPPNYAALLLPIATVPWLKSHLWWCLASIVLASAICWRLAPRGALAKFAAIAAPGTATCCLAGQNSLFSVSLLGAAALLIERQPTLAGLLIGLLSWKPTLAVPLIPFLIATRAWRTIAGATLSTTILVSISLCVGGIHPWLDWPEAAKEGLKLFTAGAINNRGGSTPFVQAITNGLDESTAKLIQTVTTAAVLLASCVYWWRRGPTKRSLALACADIPLTTPFLLYYDLAVSLVAVLILMRDRAHHRPAFATAMAGAWLSPYLTMLSAGVGRIPTITPEISLMLVLTCLFAPSGEDAPANQAKPRTARKTTAILIANAIALAAVIGGVGAIATENAERKQTAALDTIAATAAAHDITLKWKSARTSLFPDPARPTTVLTDVSIHIRTMPGSIEIPALTATWTLRDGKWRVTSLKALYAAWTPAGEKPEDVPTSAAGLGGQAIPMIGDVTLQHDAIELTGVEILIHGPDSGLEQIFDNPIENLSLDRASISAGRLLLHDTEKRTITGELKNFELDAYRTGAKTYLAIENLSLRDGRDDMVDNHVTAKQLLLSGFDSVQAARFAMRAVNSPATTTIAAGAALDRKLSGKQDVTEVPDGRILSFSVRTTDACGSTVMLSLPAFGAITLNNHQHAYSADFHFETTGRACRAFILNSAGNPGVHAGEESGSALY